eukprot:COSAG01_NODE_7027_length_3384_cov_4.728158_4_plen_68_part_00
MPSQIASQPSSALAVDRPEPPAASDRPTDGCVLAEFYGMVQAYLASKRAIQPEMTEHDRLGLCCLVD